MAKYGSGDVGFVLAGGYNLLASEVFDLTGPDVEAITEESHGLGKSYVEHTAVGLQKVTLAQNGLFDDAALGISEAMVGQHAVSRVVAIGVAGNVLGRGFTGAAGAFGGKVSRVSARGALHRLNVTYTTAGAVDEGVILLPLGAKIANWTGTTVDSLALSANGGAAYLEVTAYSGFTGVIVKVQHSDDDAIWADLATFTNVTAAPNAQRVVVASGVTVNRYLRSVGTVTGSGSLTLMSGFARA